MNPVTYVSVQVYDMDGFSSSADSVCDERAKDVPAICVTTLRSNVASGIFSICVKEKNGVC
jgi:hypothetical protein